MYVHPFMIKNNVSVNIFMLLSLQPTEQKDKSCTVS